jgi:hypothetical protein
MVTFIKKSVATDAKTILNPFPRAVCGFNMVFLATTARPSILRNKMVFVSFVF